MKKLSGEIYIGALDLSPYLNTFRLFNTGVSHLARWEIVCKDVPSQFLTPSLHSNKPMIHYPVYVSIDEHSFRGVPNSVNLAGWEAYAEVWYRFILNDLIIKFTLIKEPL
jgi:hypothetical protein